MHAAWNVLLKAAGDPLRLSARGIAAGTVISAPGIAVVWVLAGRPGLPLEAVLLAVLSAIVELFYFAMLSIAYRRGDISVVYPIARGTAPLLAVLSGLFLLGEKVGGLQLAGVLLLLAGLWALRRPQGAGPALLPALLTGVSIAVYTSIDRVGVRLGPPWLYAWLLNALVAVLLWAWIAAHPHREGGDAEAPTWRHSAIVGSLMWSSYFMILLALSVAPLVLVAPLRESAIVAVSIWGIWRLKERERKWVRLGGAAAVVAGVILVAV